MCMPSSSNKTESTHDQMSASVCYSSFLFPFVCLCGVFVCVSNGPTGRLEAMQGTINHLCDQKWQERQPSKHVAKSCFVFVQPLADLSAGALSLCCFFPIHSLLCSSAFLCSIFSPIHLLLCLSLFYFFPYPFTPLLLYLSLFYFFPIHLLLCSSAFLCSIPNLITVSIFHDLYNP